MIIRSHWIVMGGRQRLGRIARTLVSSQWGNRRRNGPSRAQGSLRMMTNAANYPSRQDWSAGGDSSNAEGIQMYSIVGGKGFHVLYDM